MSRAIVLISAAVLLAGAGVVSFLVLLLGPLAGGSPVAAAGVFTLVVVGSAAVAVGMAVRGRSAAWGCSTLLVGAAVATGLLLWLLYQR